MKPGRILFVVFLFLTFLPGHAQQLDSLLSKAEQWKLKHLMKGLYIQAYFDAYYTGNIAGSIPTSHTYEFMTNSPFINEARINMFDLALTYTNSWARLNAEFRIVDQPNLLSAASAQWTNYLNEATLGFTFGKGFWVDFGYLDSQLGVESSMPINNILSTCTVGTYYEPSSMLGGYFSYTTPDEAWSMGAWAGNAFTLASGKNIHVNYGLDVSFSPSDALTLSFNNYMGNIAKSGATYYKYLAFNNIYFTYNPDTKWNLIGQADVAFQKVSSRVKDSITTGTVWSGLLGARFYFLPKFAISMRGEVYYDPRNILIGKNYTGNTSDFIIFGASAGLEFNPGKDAYFRVQYNYLTTGDPGVKPFNEIIMTSPGGHYYADYFRQCYTITTGLRF
jgi:hypothetical protein